MSHLDILVPFGLAPAELATDLFRELNVPALATLAARSKSEGSTTRHQRFDEFSRALPHETWLSQRFGLEQELRRSGSPPIGPALMRACGLPLENGLWFVLHPVHIHIARDHLVLTDPRQLMLTEPESRDLFEIAKPLFEESGYGLRFGNEHTWFLRSDDWRSLQTSSPDAAAGHNIDIWMPKGPGERDWRKVQNEVQMHWFQNSLNAGREMRGLKAVNSLWLWGGADNTMPPAATGYTAAYNLGGWPQAFSQFVPRHVPAASVANLLGDRPANGLLLLDDLLAPALSNDWATWIDRLRRMEEDWFVPLRNGLKTGAIDSVTLVLTNDSRISRYTATRSSLRKFWVTPNLATLYP